MCIRDRTYCIHIAQLSQLLPSTLHTVYAGYKQAEYATIGAENIPPTTQTTSTSPEAGF